MEKFTSGTTALAADTDRQLLVKILTRVSDLYTVHVSAAYPIFNGVASAINFNHGLNRIPRYVRAVALATSDDNDGLTNIVAGQEIGIEFFFDPAGASQVFTSGCDADKIYLSFGGESFAFVGWSGGHHSVQDFGNFSLKVYYK